MTHPPEIHSPSQNPERPKGILKNSSYHRSNSQTSPTTEAPPIQAVHSVERPGVNRELSEKEIVLENTLKNAGAGAHRRSSSNPRGATSRRQSSNAGDADENSPRLKWDEANLYLTEQQRDSTMKITEPKTPYARQYDPLEDEEELKTLNAEEIVVDELDQAKTKRKPRMDDIPDFSLGEPEVEAGVGSHTPDSEKRVMVDVDPNEEVEGAHHGEEFPQMTPEEREKHRKFELMRRKHYEMKNVKDLLGHPEDLDDEEESQPPAQPSAVLANGQ